jgi:hypothetical protein
LQFFAFFANFAIVPFLLITRHAGRCQKVKLAFASMQLCIALQFPWERLYLAVCIALRAVLSNLQCKPFAGQRYLQILITGCASRAVLHFLQFFAFLHFLQITRHTGPRELQVSSCILVHFTHLAITALQFPWERLYLAICKQGKQHGFAVPMGKAVLSKFAMQVICMAAFVASLNNKVY